jgi:hypothetical protein
LRLPGLMLMYRPTVFYPQRNQPPDRIEKEGF